MKVTAKYSMAYKGIAYKAGDKLDITKDEYEKLINDVDKVVGTRKRKTKQVTKAKTK